MWKDGMHCVLRSDPEGNIKTATMVVAHVIDSSTSTGTRRRHMKNQVHPIGKKGVGTEQVKTTLQNKTEQKATQRLHSSV
jgi:hypothetical protein